MKIMKKQKKHIVGLSDHDLFYFYTYENIDIFKCPVGSVSRESVAYISAIIRCSFSICNIVGGKLTLVICIYIL